MSVSPFLNVIKEQDKELSARIIANELPGVLNWALIGMRRYLARGFEFKAPESVVKVTQKMQDQSDVIGLWLEDCYAVDMTKVDDPWRTEWKVVYASYKKWCEENGHHPHSNKSTAKALRERFRFTDDDDAKWPSKSNGLRWATGFREVVVGESATLIERILDDNSKLRSKVYGTASSPSTGKNPSARSARFSETVVSIDKARRRK